MFRKLLDEGRAGENVGVLRGIKREEIERGQVLAGPSSRTLSSNLEVYILSKDEGGPSYFPFLKLPSQFYFRTTDVTGTVNCQA